MHDNKEKQQQETAFGARIDKVYETFFNEQLDKHKDADGNLPRGAKKRLLEKIIYEYHRNKRNEEKEDALSLESEVSLIASNLESILDIFKRIKIKAQDTLIAERTNSEQTIKNYKTDIETEKNKNTALESRNKELELSNETFEEAKANLLSQIEKFKEDKQKVEKELQEQKLENANLLKTNNSLEKANHESKEFIMELKKNLEGTSNELHSFKSLVKTNEETISSLENRIKNLKHVNDELRIGKEKDIEDVKSLLENRIKDLQKTNDDLRNNKEKDIEEIKTVLKEKIEVEKEKAILDIKKEQYEIQKEFNTLQLKSIELARTINSKDLEVSRLSNEVERYKEIINEITESNKNINR